MRNRSKCFLLHHHTRGAKKWMYCKWKQSWGVPSSWGSSPWKWAWNPSVCDWGAQCRRKRIPEEMPSVWHYSRLVVEIKSALQNLSDRRDVLSSHRRHSDEQKLWAVAMAPPAHQDISRQREQRSHLDLLLLPATLPKLRKAALSLLDVNVMCHVLNR